MVAFSECNLEIFNSLFIFFFFYLHPAGSCPPSPHPRGDPANSFRVATRGLTLNWTSHTFNSTERCMGLLVRQPDNCPLHGIGMYSHSHDVAYLWFNHIHMFAHASHRRGRESNPDLSDDSTEYIPLHHAPIKIPSL